MPARIATNYDHRRGELIAYINQEIATEQRSRNDIRSDFPWLRTDEQDERIAEHDETLAFLINARSAVEAL